MFVYIYQYKNIDPNEFEMVVPFEILPMPSKMITVSSTDSQSSQSNYKYEPILKKVLASTYMKYPFYLIVETYSKGLIEKVISKNQLKSLVLLEKANTDVFKVVIEDEKDLLSMLPILYTSGTDSLFNLMTEFDEIICLKDNQISVDLSKNPESKSLFFLHDLQELCFLGYDEPQDRAFIKSNFLQGSVIVDDLEREL